MDLNKLTLSDKIIAGTGLVLLIDLLFLPWHNVDLGFVSSSRSAIESPNGFWGILALLLTAAVLVVTLLRVLKPETQLPDLPISWDQAIFYGTVAVEALLVIKLVLETEFLGFGAWLGLLLGAGMIYGGFLKFQADRQGSGTSEGSAGL